jgi:hypothetical protein
MKKSKALVSRRPYSLSLVPDRLRAGVLAGLIAGVYPARSMSTPGNDHGPVSLPTTQKQITCLLTSVMKLNATTFHLNQFDFIIFI